MVTVIPGGKVPLSVTIGDHEAGLVVKAYLETMAGVALTTITLTEVSDGDFLDYSYTMPYGQTYIKARFEVYDSDGTTLNPNNGATDELYGIVTPIYVQTIKVKLDCEAQGEASPPVVVQTSDENFLLTFQDQDGNGFNTSDASTITVRFRKIDGTTMTKSLTDGITAVNAFVGQYLLTMVAADFALLPSGGTGINMQTEVVISAVKHVNQLKPAFIIDASIV